MNMIEHVRTRTNMWRDTMKRASVLFCGLNYCTCASKDSDAWRPKRSQKYLSCAGQAKLLGVPKLSQYTQYRGSSLAGGFNPSMPTPTSWWQILHSWVPDGGIHSCPSSHLYSKHIWAIKAFIHLCCELRRVVIPSGNELAKMFLGVGLSEKCGKQQNWSTLLSSWGRLCDDADDDDDADADDDDDDDDNADDDDDDDDDEPGTPSSDKPILYLRRTLRHGIISIVAHSP